MKFIYVDESGERNHSDVFTMCGVMVDAYSLRGKTADMNTRLRDFLRKHPGNETELKTSRVINGAGGWSKIDPQKRKEFLLDICHVACSLGNEIYGVGLSFNAFKKAKKVGYSKPNGFGYWLASAGFTCSLVQKKMQAKSKNKGLTVVIVDDNKKTMPKLSNMLYDRNSWFDGLYKTQRKIRGKNTWTARKAYDRFDQIINTAFAIQSNHSSFIQVADAVAYVYRRHLELMGQPENWKGEKKYYQTLIDLLEPRRQKLGRCPDEPCVQFFKAAKHPGWEL